MADSDGTYHLGHNASSETQIVYDVGNLGSTDLIGSELLSESQLVSSEEEKFFEGRTNSGPRFRISSDTLDTDTHDELPLPRENLVSTAVPAMTLSSPIPVMAFNSDDLIALQQGNTGYIAQQDTVPATLHNGIVTNSSFLTSPSKVGGIYASIESFSSPSCSTTPVIHSAQVVPNSVMNTTTVSTSDYFLVNDSKQQNCFTDIPVMPSVLEVIPSLEDLIGVESESESLHARQNYGSTHGSMFPKESPKNGAVLNPSDKRNSEARTPRHIVSVADSDSLFAPLTSDATLSHSNFLED